MDSSQLHKPVMFQEVLTGFENFFSDNEPLLILDGTFGRGGHYKKFLELFKDRLSYIGLDQDLDAVSFAKRTFSKEISTNKLQILHANFSNLEEVEKIVDGRELNAVFLDIGVSSPQLDNAKRGFSFYQNGPLDMRMNQNLEVKASDVLNTESLEDLRDIFLTYGEIYAPNRLLTAIDEKRKEKAFSETLELSNLIEKVCGWRKKGSHPATQYFQALRLFVNKELESLDDALINYQKLLKSGGLFCVISFHSLEDRKVKHSFRNSTYGKPINKKVIKATDQEISENKRSRSAKLRFFKKNSENTTD